MKRTVPYLAAGISTLKQNKSLLLVISFFVVYTAAWSAIVLGKFYSLHSSVFDLGFIMDRLWQVYNIGQFSYHISLLFSNGFQYILSPLLFTKSYQVLLLVQVFALGASVFPLYGIAESLTQNRTISAIISASYLLYFPSSGILWFDVHFQAFFVPLFIFAYYFYIKEKFVLAAILFVLSGTVRFPYIIFPLGFALFEIASLIGSRKLTDRALKMNFVVLSVSLVFLLSGYYFLLTPGNNPVYFAASPLGFRITHELLTFIIIMAPVFFLPVLSPRWLIMTGPFFLLGLYTGSARYVYPELMTEQYTAMVLPFVFIGTIEVLARFNRGAGSEKGNEPSRSNPVGRLKKGLKRRNVFLTFLILAAMLTASMFYAPYGPLNPYVVPTYSLSRNVNFNQTDYNTLLTVISLIPRSDPYVLFQNDMPEFLPRSSPPNSTLPFLATPFLSSNITLGEVVNNSFPIRSVYYNGPVYTNIDYAVAFVKSDSFYFQLATSDATVPQLLYLMLESGKYGILAEDNGFIVLERGYNAPPRLYVPLEMKAPFNATNPKGGTTFADINGTPVGSSTHVALVPGTYSVTFNLSFASSASNNSAMPALELFLGYQFGKFASNGYAARLKNASLIGRSIEFTWNVNVPNVEPDTVFAVSSINYPGQFTVYSVKFVQLSWIV